MLTIYHDRYSFLLILCKKNKKELINHTELLSYQDYLTKKYKAKRPDM